MSRLTTVRALLGLPLHTSPAGLVATTRAQADGLLPPRTTPRPGGKRQTIESLDQQKLFSNGFQALVAPPEPNALWRTLDVTPDVLRRMPANRVIEVLAELSPEVTRALWDFLRMCNPGWSVKAVEPGTDRPHPAGQKALDAFMARLEGLYGSADIPLNKMFFGLYLRGAVMAELVLDADGYEAVDLATPDPAIARFEQKDDPVRGTVWQLGQLNSGAYQPLLSPLVRYIPLDPWPGTPYGRSPVVPAIFASLFLLSLLHDMKRVIGQQGYPRLDIMVDLEELRNSAPPMVLGDPKAWIEWVHAVVEEVKEAYLNLEPDQALVHTSTVKVEGPVGAVDAGSLGAFTGIIEMLEGQLTRALKTMPLLMSGGGASEASSNRQWEIEATGRGSVQALVAACLNYLGTQLLQAQGIPAEAKFLFETLRAAERFRNAQTESIEIENAYAKYWLGAMSYDELCMTLTGNLPIEKKPLQDLVTPAILGSGSKAVPQKAGNGSPDNKAAGDSKDSSANRITRLLDRLTRRFGAQTVATLLDDEPLDEAA